MKEFSTRIPIKDIPLAERNGPVQPAGVVFDQTVHGDLSIPSEVRKAGLLVAKNRDGLPVSQFRLARLSGVHQNTFKAFEAGTGYTELAPVYDAMSQYLYERNASMEQLEKLRNNQQWFRTFTQPGMTTGDHIELMALADWQTPVAFAHKAGIKHGKGIHQFINDRKRPYASTFNDLISASVLDPDSKAAQYARLQRSRQQPMTLSQFSTAPIHKLARYIRNVYGLTAEQTGAQVHYSKSAVLLFEKGTRTITPEIIDAYAQWLGLPATSPLLWSLRFKAAFPDKALPDEVLPLVFAEERLLFQEHIDQVRSYPLTAKDRELLTELKPLQTASQKLKQIKMKYKLPIRPKVEINDVESTVAVDNITQDGRIPTGINIMKVMLLTGRDIHNPVAHDVLKTAKKERIAKMLPLKPKRKSPEVKTPELQAA